LASLRRANTADHAAEIGVMGLLTKPSFSLSKMFAPTERSSAPSSAVLILGQRWSLRSFIDLQTYCGDFVAPARSKPACLRCRAKFGPPAGKSRPVDSLNPARSKLRPGPMDIAKALMRTDVTICWSATRNRCEPLCRRRSVDGRSPAPLPNVSCACPILTQPWLTARATTKRDCGARRRKQY
jgi:hypothetical protein